VTPARNQDTCGSCWAFAACGAAEGNWAVRHGKQMIDLSEQHVLDCCDSHACEWGWLYKAVDFLVKKGTCKETEDKYVSKKRNTCPVKPVNYRAVASDLADGLKPSVASIKQAILDHGPVAAFIYGEDMNLPSYFGADVVITDDPQPHNDQYNHFIVIVGWDDTKAGGRGAWEIKNTWKEGGALGKWWGRKGFGYVAYDVRRVGDEATWVESR
jgi:C1A family cysteine protease